MFRREMKVNFKNFIIWFTILVVLYLIVFLIYPSIIHSDNIKMIDEMMKIFPDEVLKAFNMDISSLSSVYGWLKSEGFVFILLIVGSYAGILGSNILLKEENDKTIEYLNALPLRRNKIVCSKALVGFVYVILMVLAIGVFNFIGLSLSGKFDHRQYLLLSITPIFSSSVLYFLCLFLSSFTHKSKKIVGISLGIVFLSYVFQILSTMSREVDFLKYFSIYTLADIRNVIVDVSIRPIMIVVSVLLCILFLGLTLVRYNKKELI